MWSNVEIPFSFFRERKRGCVAMKLLEERILRDGKVFAGDVLKVDRFLNHQIDVDFLCELGKEFHHLYGNCGVNKILTVEASGIGVACLTAQYFHCPVVFAKKSKTSNIGSDLWAATAHSYTHGTDNTLVVSKEYLGEGDTVLILDDFLANGCAAKALLSLCEQAGAKVVGVGTVIEKAYQKGGDELRARGVRVESLARIASMSQTDGIRFCD